MNIAATAHIPLSHFPALAESIKQHFNVIAKDSEGQLFVVDPGVDLYDLYLDNLPPHLRQEHTCSCCRTFIHRFGALVVIGETGRTYSAVWPDETDVDEPYAASIKAMRRAVEAGQVKSVFLCSEPLLGTPEAGGFDHFAVRNPKVYESRLLTAGQAMAEKREHFGTLSRGVAEFGVDTVNQALTLLEADTLYRSDKVLAPARFLKGVHDALAGAKGKDAKRNVIWRAVAAGSAGFCTPRSSMIGTLLEDIAAGLDFGDVSRKFKAKMHPLLYQRPQTDASSGNIAQAEAIFEKLGLAPSLRRRFARLDEIPTIWKPAVETPQEATKGGVFANLKARDTVSAEPMTTPAVNVSWAKFVRSVLPGALAIDVKLAHNTSYGALVTAVDPEAPLLFQWDNPVSWYLYHGGSSPSRWGLTGQWGKVTGITLQPNQWGNDDPSPGAMLIIEGAVDRDVNSLALFPETLRSELHQVRRTIEQFSRTSKIEGADEASACGLILGKSNADVIRVRTAIGTSFYRIDRWE